MVVIKSSKFTGYPVRNWRFQYISVKIFGICGKLSEDVSYLMAKKQIYYKLRPMNNTRYLFVIKTQNVNWSEKAGHIYDRGHNIFNLKWYI